jgi:hypothetical protein
VGIQQSSHNCDMLRWSAKWEFGALCVLEDSHGGMYAARLIGGKNPTLNVGTITHDGIQRLNEKYLTPAKYPLHKAPSLHRKTFNRHSLQEE